MKKLLLVCLILYAGCTSSTSEDGRIFTDDLGREITLPDSISRIVTLAPSLTDLLAAAGAHKRIVGVSNADDHQALPPSTTRFSALPVDFETVTTLKPDVVLATDQVNNPRDAETFRSLDIPVVFFSFHRVGDVPRVLDSLGAVLQTERASAIADSLRDKRMLFESRTDTLSSRPRVLFLISDAPLYAFGGDSYVNEMVRLAGGDSVTDSIETSTPVLDEEFVLEARPHIIIGTFGETYKSSQLLRLHPSWEHVPAVRDDRVYTIPEDWVLRPSPNIFRGIQRMTEILHPELADSIRTVSRQP